MKTYEYDNSYLDEVGSVSEYFEEYVNVYGPYLGLAVAVHLLYCCHVPYLVVH